MTDVPYCSSYVQMGWRKEESYRKVDASGSYDQQNLAGDTFHYIPLRLLRNQIPFIQNRKNITFEGVAWSQFTNIMRYGSYKQMEITLEGPMIDFSLMLYVFGGATNAGSGPYYHYFDFYDNASLALNTSIVNPPPSFQIWVKVPNDGGSSIIQLWNGCIIKDCKISSTKNDFVRVAYTILIGTITSGLDLTNPPQWPNGELYTYGNAEITFSGSSYSFSFRNIDASISILTDRTLLDNFGNGKPEQARGSSKTDIFQELTVEPKNNSMFSQENDLSDTVNVKIKFLKQNGHVFQLSLIESRILITKEEFVDNFLQYQLKIMIDPTNLGNHISIAEVNDLDNTKYT